MRPSSLSWERSSRPASAGPIRPSLAHFARTTFLSDNRQDLQRVTTPALVVQCRDDVIAPVEVGRYVLEHLRDGEFALLDTTGHCPNLSAPKQLIEAIEHYLVRA